MDLKKLELEARSMAIKDLKNMLQRPGQLEKVEQYRHRVARKKASVETMLKTAMQNQLDGVRVGLKQLESSLSDIKEIDMKVNQVDQLMEAVPKIYENLESVREENTRHSQYMTAMENLKHIFTVQASVAKTRQWIEEGKLLHAHQVSPYRCCTNLARYR
jgi:exocyst complex component 3